MRKISSALIIVASIAVILTAASAPAEARWGYGWHGGGWGWRGGGWGWRGGWGWGGATLGLALATPYYGYGYGYDYVPYNYGYYSYAPIYTPIYSYDPYFCGDCDDY